MCIQLGLHEIDKREAVTVDGEVHVVPVVGPVNVHFQNRIADFGLKKRTV